MRNLSSIILLVVLCSNVFAQSPHGKEFKKTCSDCHTTEGWKIDLKKLSFNHDKTKFPLVGQHQVVNCRSCHQSLVFTGVETDCKSCHTDIHYQTVGFECERCHTPKSWIVENITGIHQNSRFPLVGPHVNADCEACHPSESLLRFEPLGVECYDCHKDQYMATTTPNHVQSNYSTNCEECHLMTSFDWSGANINHSFFPLTGGHGSIDCISCHTSGVFSKIPAECVACHQSDYNATTNPNHVSIGFPTTCNDCHSLNPGWKPADYKEHDALFPIYSGAHSGIACNECHTNTGDYTTFSCTVCHNQGDMDGRHGDVGGYSYNSLACYECHPTGSAEGGFNHSTSNFPLTGAHITTECSGCHANGFAGTPTVCFACHENNFNQTTNPNHNTAGIGTECETCHTTDPTWKPALFPNHNESYPLLGAHATIATNCFACHNGNYVNTPNLCYGCHSANYNQANNPNHITAQFSTTCETCHSETAWTPATFDHDGQYFPIYSGKHLGTWTVCSDCHTNPGDYALYTCITCHQQVPTDQGHNGVGGYTYNNIACFECHPTGSAEGSFNHANSNFPLTGAHSTTECVSCHANGYSGTPTICFACHQNDFNQSADPNHSALGIPTECETCHTTNPGWQPATFPIHNNYYPLTGQHLTVASDCNICHGGSYNNTPNVCAGCHLDNYNQSVNPNHNAIGIPTDCETCHTTSPDWQPATFPIHSNYYPLVGAHAAIAGNCFTCHEGNYVNTPNLCYGCHSNDYLQTTNPNHVAAQFPTNCESCHTETAWTPATFDHDGQYFPIYSGHHQGTWNACADCHSNPGDYSIFTCTTSCHPQGQTDGSHNGIGGYSYNSPACFECHPTGSSEGAFNHNNSNFPLTGAHLTTDCISCHANGYAGTPTICFACHESDFDQSVNPNHITLGIPNDCETCHTTTPGWQPAAFPIHNNYYPLTGAHQTIASDCNSCHAGDYNNTPNVCSGCHMDNYNQSTNPNHAAIGIPTNCETCHTTNPDWQPASFPIHNQYYPLTGAHLSIASDCYVCHQGDYNNTPNVCVGCHLTDYNQTTNPDHDAIGIGTDCATCHTTNPGWQPATFPIHNQYWPLTGAHINTSCDACHNGNYNSTPNTCAGCHMDDYNGATDPNHVAAGFPTTCEDCHTTVAWVPSTFDHDGMYFPIYSGSHAGHWNTCSQCHPNPNDFGVFTCLTCHQQGETNGDHQGVPGYQYNSDACYACHPTGQSGGGGKMNMMKRN